MPYKNPEDARACRRRWYHRHREEQREVQRQYRARTREAKSERHRAWRKKNPDYDREWRLKHPEKAAAHDAVSNGVRNGVLVKQPCEVCSAEPAEAHHDDYSKPLDVRWLCRAHHLEHHARERKLIEEAQAA